MIPPAYSYSSTGVRFTLVLQVAADPPAPNQTMQWPLHPSACSCAAPRGFCFFGFPHVTQVQTCDMRWSRSPWHCLARTRRRTSGDLTTPFRAIKQPTNEQSITDSARAARIIAGMHSGGNRSRRMPGLPHHICCASALREGLSGSQPRLHRSCASASWHRCSTSAGAVPLSTCALYTHANCSGCSSTPGSS